MENKRKVHFIESDEIFPVPMYVTRARIASAHITSEGGTITAKLSTGEARTDSFDGIVRMLRLRHIDADHITMPNKDATDSPTPGQRIALHHALKKREMIGLHLLVERSDFASVEELEGCASLSDLARWTRSGEIFAINHEGTDLYPLYGFEKAARLTPWPMLQQIIATLDMDAWHAAWWFLSGCSMLDGQRPQDLLDFDPEAVLTAAIDQKRGITHG